MSGKGLLVKLKSFVGKITKKQKNKQIDIVEVNLPGLNIKMSRNIDLDTPHEVTIVIPRAKMRKTCHNDDCSKYEYELIYSSITVVHAPRHPLAGPSTFASEEMPENFQS